MSQYKESYFFRNNHKMGKARVPTFYILDTLKKYLFTALSPLLLVVDASKMPSARSLLQSMHSMIKNVLRLAHFTCSLGGCPPISQHTSKNFFFVTFHEVPNSNCSIVRTSGKFTIRWAKTISEKQRKQNISIEIY